MSGSTLADAWRLTSGCALSGGLVVVYHGYDGKGLLVVAIEQHFSPAASVRSVKGNPSGLVTLLAMLRFHAHHFVAISNTLGQAMMDIRSGRVPEDRTLQGVTASCGLLMKYCEELGLPLSVAHLRRFHQDTLRPGVAFQTVLNALEETQHRVWDELASRVFLAVAEGKAKYYEDSQFPASVFERFPEATFDAAEAGKCLALERPTACVFHLMRVTEYGLRAIGKFLGIKDPRPNWEPIIAKIDSELKKPYKDRRFQGSADLLAHVSAHLNAVKIAWRNLAMHVGQKHTPEEAMEIHNATCGLMRYLAENLPKPSTCIVTVVREKLGL